MVRLPTCTYLLHAQGDHHPAVDGVNAVFTVFLELFEVPLLHGLFPRRRVADKTLPESRVLLADRI